MPTLVQLSYLTAVDRFRHFGQAARHAGVTQPTLSMQLKKLEEELGVELFDRTRHPVEPTDAGRLVVAQARRVLREAERLNQVLRDSAAEVAGEIRVGILPTLAPYLLPAAVSDLRERYPDLQLRVEELRTDEVIDALEADRLDVGVVATAVEDARLRDRPLFEEPFVGYLSETHRLWPRPRIEPCDLSAAELWLLQEGHCFREQVVSLCGGEEGESEGVAGVRFEATSVETLKRLVERTGGMTLLPLLATLEMRPEEAKRVRRFADPQPTRTVRLVHHRGYIRTAAVDALSAELLRAVPTELRIGRGG